MKFVSRFFAFIAISMAFTGRVAAGEAGKSQKLFVYV